MYIGHFMAWIAASILYAVQLHQDPANTAVLPGPLAYAPVASPDLLCVVVAGWTTANPTLYRAGLAFQSLIPTSSRFKVTLITGLIASVTAVFPIVTMRLLDFVALWGMILMPMGAVIFVDFWVLPKLGLRSNFAAATGAPFNWAAGLAWLLTIGVCTGLVLTGRTQIFFVSLPGWFITSLLYVALSKLLQGPLGSTGRRLSHETHRASHLLSGAGGDPAAGGAVLCRQGRIAAGQTMDAGRRPGLVRRLRRFGWNTRPSRLCR